MHPLVDKKTVLRELDLAISRLGMVAYNNHIYGTADDIDMIYVLKLERARQHLTGKSSQTAIDYASRLLTTTSHNGQ